MFVITNSQLIGRFRKLKIYQKHQPREWECITVPDIRLEGKSLKELGFEIGKEIEIK